MSESQETDPLHHTSPGALYVVATPIGNLSDWSSRAREVLTHSDLVLCEDTRTSRVLLDHYGITRPLKAFHDHNEDQQTGQLVQKLLGGAKIALISDAGTPLISDPGFRLVAAARLAGVAVLTVPGACAAVAGLSVCGLPCERFIFEGFLPASKKARVDRLEALLSESRTLVFYESTHRIVDMLTDLVNVFGGDRRAAVCKELTKRFERTITDSLATLLKIFETNAQLRRGEFVVIVEGAAEEHASAPEARRVLAILAEALPPALAAKLTSKITGIPRKQLYGGVDEAL